MSQVVVDLVVGLMLFFGFMFLLSLLLAAFIGFFGGVAKFLFGATVVMVVVFISMCIVDMLKEERGCQGGWRCR